MAAFETVVPILQRLKATLRQLYGARLHEMILYGSYARGDAGEGSDLDILLVLENVHDPLAEREQLSTLLWQLSLEQHMVFSVLPVDAQVFQYRNSPLFLNIKREGIPIQ